jgi:hypothetical protein
MEYLYAFRNCLTHNAGIVDEALLEKLQKINPACDLLTSNNIGQPLILDASTATSFADSVQHIARSLLVAAQGMCETRAP